MFCNGLSQDYIRCTFKNEKGTKAILPLSITEAAVPAKAVDETEAPEGTASKNTEGK